VNTLDFYSNRNELAVKVQLTALGDAGNNNSVRDTRSKSTENIGGTCRFFIAIEKPEMLLIAI